MSRAKGKRSNLLIIFLFLLFSCPILLFNNSVFAGINNNEVNKIWGDCGYYAPRGQGGISGWGNGKVGRKVDIDDLQDSIVTGTSLEINHSLYEACYKYHSSTNKDNESFGALWISSFKGPHTGNSKDNYNDRALAVLMPNTTSNDGKINAYLAGVVVNKGGFGAGAKNICIVKGSTKLIGKIGNSNKGTPDERFDADCKAKGYPGVILPSSKMSRYGYEYKNSAINHQKDGDQVKFSVMNIKIDVDYIMKKETKTVFPGSNFSYYDIPLQVFRCYDGKHDDGKPITYGDTACYSDTTNLRLVLMELPCKEYGGYCGSELKLVQRANGKEGVRAVSGLNKSKSEKSTSGSTTIYARPGNVELTGSFESSNQKYMDDKKAGALSIVDASTFLGKDGKGSIERYRQNSKKLENSQEREWKGYSKGWNGNPNPISIGNYIKLFYSSPQLDGEPVLGNIENLYEGNLNGAAYGTGWNNAFTIVTSEDVAHSNKSSFLCGDDRAVKGNAGKDELIENTINYTVRAGSKLHSQSRLNDHTDGCTKESFITPFSIQFTPGDSFDTYKATINNTSQKTDKLEVIVPYNFKNSISINDGASGGTVYAGEQKTIRYTTKTGPKTAPNGVGGDPYLTYVPKISIKAQVCNASDGSCGPNDSWSDIEGTEESMSNPFGLLSTQSYEGILKSISRNTTITIPDYPAGSKICVRFGVFPAMSQEVVPGVSDGRSVDGNGQWAYSKGPCFTVAKRPSFQIWGGSLYSNGNITLPDVTKTFTVKNDKGEDEDITRTFGSWVELGIRSKGKVTGLSSGAGTGYAATDDAINILGNRNDGKWTGLENLGGSSEENFCKNSTLSIPNNNCGPKSIGKDTTLASDGDKSNLVKMFDGDIGEDDIKIGPETIPDSTPSVTKTKGDVIIKGNITYEDKKYTNLQDIPKRIIYANNIKINCNVTRIDAVLIAEENINTCADGDDDNDQKRSTQLIINGSTISDTLTLGRTYGAATRANSAIPAEIINYDTSLYLWARKNDDTIRNGAIIEKNRRELPPRY